MVLSHWILSNAGQDKQGLQTLWGCHIKYALEACGSPRLTHAGTGICHHSCALAQGREAGKEKLLKAKIAESISVGSCYSRGEGNMERLEKFILKQN